MKGSSVIAAALLSTLAVASPKGCAPANTVTITQVVTSIVTSNNPAPSVNAPAAVGQDIAAAVVPPAVVTITETQGGGAGAAPSVVAAPVNPPPAGNVPVDGTVNVDAPVAQDVPAVPNIDTASPAPAPDSDKSIVEPPDTNDDTLPAGPPPIVLKTVVKVVTTIISDINQPPKTLIVTKVETHTSHRVNVAHKTAHTDSKASPTHYVAVGKGGKMAFEPSFINANEGQTVRFRFFPKNHTVTSSDFESPCNKSGNFDSGFKSVLGSNSTTFVDFQVPKTDKPLWFHSRQQDECKQGMVFAINPKSEEHFHKFVEIAKGEFKNGTHPDFKKLNETRLRNSTEYREHHHTSTLNGTAILNGTATLNATTTHSTSSSTTGHPSSSTTEHTSSSTTGHTSSSTTEHTSSSTTEHTSSSTTDHTSSSTSPAATSTAAHNARRDVPARFHNRRSFIWGN